MKKHLMNYPSYGKQPELEYVGFFLTQTREAERH